MMRKGVLTVSVFDTTTALLRLLFLILSLRKLLHPVLIVSIVRAREASSLRLVLRQGRPQEPIHEGTALTESRGSAPDNNIASNDRY
jgi:hypothetical protein